MLSFILNRNHSPSSLLYRETFFFSLYINNIFQFFIHPQYKSIPFCVKNEKMLNYKIPSMNKKIPYTNKNIPLVKKCIYNSKIFPYFEFLNNNDNKN